MTNKSTKTHTLGHTSAVFINDLLKKEKVIFTINDAIAIYRKGRGETSDFIRKLIRRGIIERINAGLYIILQPGKEYIQLSNWPSIAHALAGSNDYFIAYYSAMRIHGMTTHSLNNVYVASPKRHRDKEILNITYNFIYIKKQNFWGYSSYWITKEQQINVSDLERTILDGLERPELCGGITEVANGIWLKQRDINWQTLIKYAKEYPTLAAIKRLGCLLETLELGDNLIQILLGIIENSKSYLLLDPTQSNSGKYYQRWRIRLNIDLSEIKKST